MNLFIDAKTTNELTQKFKAYKPKSNTEMAAIKIQKNIDYAVECGRSKVTVFTGDFGLTPPEREALTFNLQKAGYKYLWMSCGNEDERVQVCWSDC